LSPRGHTIGVFDSGVGGLSVLKALLTALPASHFVYLADGSHAPYGERSPRQIADRAHRITDRLRENFGIDALVVACNTATALAIEGLRAQHLNWPIIGVEPALKPAAALTRSGHVGVLATRGTVESERFARLRDRLQSEAKTPLHISSQACDGLADAIERDDQPAIRRLAQHYLGALETASRGVPAMDTLVLGCTHYPFASEVLQELSGPGVALVETGTPVARHTRTVLAEMAPTEPPPHPGVTLLSTGNPLGLEEAAERWLGLKVKAQRLDC
jgi:glutamate racemase